MSATPEHPGTLPGLVEWFRLGEHDRVDASVAGLKRLGIQRLRTGISWADYATDSGAAWYDWLLPRLAADFELVPCLASTPPWQGVVGKPSAPPRDPKAFADFIDVMISRHPGMFEHLELWAAPSRHSDWDVRLDPTWMQFCKMVGSAAYWVKQRGLKTVLPGTCPADPAWLDLMGQRGVLQYIDVVGLNGFPGTWETDWEGWPVLVAGQREVLDRHGVAPQLWITETGFSTWRHDERGQIRAFLNAVDSPVDRVYWSSFQDLHPLVPSREGFHVDERHYFMGMVRADGSPKLLGRLLESGGLAAVRDVDRLSRPAPLRPAKSTAKSTAKGMMGAKPMVITGGAGFIGTNLADRLAREGHRVLVFDNLARAGVEQNIDWLKATHGSAVTFELADIRDSYTLRHAVRQAGRMFHFAAQVAVTTSLVDPITDFEVNARGTINLLEAMRERADPPPLVFTSTNKVYGKLADVGLDLDGDRYVPTDCGIRARGIGEDRPLDFYSPYGASKGSADQYVLDYARTYGLPAAVFRMSCIYGPHQFGTEDQGWVAHFLIRALDGQPITLYGDGKQVRDILFVEDLVEAFLAAQASMPAISGQAFNIGGGPDNAVSLIELLNRIGTLTGCHPDVKFGPWRPGDQLYYVSDTTKFRTATGWKPQVGIAEGVGQLAAWLASTRAREVADLRRAAS